MKIRSAAFIVASLIIVILLGACVGAPPSTSGNLPGSTGQQAPLTDAEKERMELDAVYRAIKSGDFASAEGKLAGLVLARPDNRSYPVLRASVLLSMKRPDEARAVLDKELDAYPDNTDALFALAELERFAGNDKAHQTAIEAIIKRDPANAEAQAAMGDIQYQGKNYTKAESSYAAALLADPKNVSALLGRARVLYRRDDMHGALDSLNTAIGLAPEEPLAYLDRSRVLYQLGRYDECEADMNTAIKLAPESSWNYLERGRLYLDTGRSKQALADFTRSIELNPEYFLAYVYRAAIYEDQGNDAAAFADYRKSTSLYPDYWYAFESIGMVAYRLGNWTDAYQAFDKAATYTKAHGEYYIAAAVSLMRSGDPKAAREYAGRNLARINREQNPTQWLALRLLYDQNDTTTELELKISAEKSQDLKAGMLFYLGSYWVARGRSELGLRYIQMSIDSQRVGTMERRMAEADLARLQSKP
ncbi:MAG TPA: tetratricopeptide repeat protein [bacterium]|nr:tetratricopeptide repeat protein [bacterium]